MVDFQNRRFWANCLIGTLLTITVLAGDWAGYLDPLENWFYDYRARIFTAPIDPEKISVVHVDIDDLSLGMIGRWPWPRDYLAQLIDEISLAHPKFIALDELLDAPEAPALQKTNHGMLAIDNDAALAKAIARAGNVILATSVKFAPRRLRDQREVTLTQLLTANLELTPAEALAQLQAMKMEASDLKEFVAANFVPCRAAAFLKRLDHAQERLGKAFDPAKGEEQLRPLVLPHLDPRYVTSPLLREMPGQYAEMLAQDQVSRFCLPMQTTLPDLLRVSDVTAPINRFSQRAAGIGFVDYLPSTDGVVRNVPLLVMYDKQLLPSFSLMTACSVLGAKMTGIQCTSDTLTIPLRGGKLLRVPVRNVQSQTFGKVAMFMDVPWPSNDPHWETMYDIPDHKKPLFHESVNKIWEACSMRQRLESNQASANSLIDDLAQNFYPDLPPAGPRLPQRIDAASMALRQDIDRLATQGQLSADELSLQQLLRQRLDTLQKFKKAISELTSSLTALRTDLHEEFNGKVVLIGWIATGERDFVATSLSPRCPGVVVHAALINGIINGRFWRALPSALTNLVTVAMGLLATVIVAIFSPILATLFIVIGMVSYILVNGYVLFNLHGFMMGMAGPMVATGGVWGGLLLKNQVSEIAERTWITRQFSSFSPEVVAYLLKHPSRRQLPIEERELTVVFTDLVNFTAIVEQLRQESIHLLGDYLQKMVPAIREKHGVIKFIGDGIMCFFGAPEANPNHAIDAVSAALKMQRELANFNLRFASHPTIRPLAMRIGINTGRMDVGNIGPKEMCDYTVIGDAVNLASRLEGANKKFGTHNLAAQATIDLLDEQFLVRPVARIKVLGRGEPVMIHEILCPAAHADPAAEHLVEITQKVVNAFLSDQLDACEAALEELQALPRQEKFVAMYRKQCQAARLELQQTNTYIKIITLDEK